MIEHIRLMRGFDIDTPVFDMNEVQESARANFLNAVDDGLIILLQRDACLCGSTSRSAVSATDRFGLPFGSYLCRECGLIYTSPYISPRSVSRYYEDYYHDLHFGKPPMPGKALFAKGQGDKVFRLTKDRLPGRAVRVLEVGSAGGSVIKEFVVAAGESGLEVSGLGLEYDAENAACFDPEGLNILMRHGGVEDLRPGDGPFDIVIMSHVLEHFAQPDMELGILKGMLREGGLLYVEVPGLFRLRSSYKDYNCDYLRYFTGAHMFNFNLRALAHVLGMSGYSLLWGNEEVEAIFAPGGRKVDVSGNALLVGSYIDDIETSRKFYQSLWSDIARLSSENARIEKKADTLMKDVAVLKDDSENLRRFPPYRLYSWLRRKLRI